MGGDRTRSAWEGEGLEQSSEEWGMLGGSTLPQRLMGTGWACLGPTDPEISRCCWCQDLVSQR